VKHVLSISTLYPNPVEPDRGGFVARSLKALINYDGEWKVSVINPIGIPPVPFGRARELALLEETAEEGGVAVHRSRYTRLPKIGGRTDAGAIAKAASPLVKRIHAEMPIDLVHAQLFFPDGPAAATIAQRLGVPLSIKARGNDIIEWGATGSAQEEILAAALQADGLLAVSEAMKRRMIDLGMDSRKITVHRTGLDRDRFRPLDHDRLRAQLGEALGFVIPDNAPLLVCVGALAEPKGQDIAIAALARIEGARLVLVGSGEDERHLRELAGDLGLAERIHFAGSRDHDMLPLILSAADVMVLPTSGEGLANPWVESLACGTPVVTTDTGGAREVIIDDTAGRLVKREPESVADAVNAVLNDPPLRREVAERAARFSWERHARELAAHYDRLIASVR